MTESPTVETTDSLSLDVTDSVLALVEQAAAADGFPALNEAALLRLRHPHPGTTHLVTRVAGEVVGYGQVQIAELALRHPQARAAGALVVHPRHRRQGLGTSLVQQMITVADHRLEIWGTRNTPAARALAARVGLVPVRQLLIMSRSLAEPVAVTDVPPGLSIRAFRPDSDEEGWLAVNARAFAHHPEQGGITRADLDERMREPWFDPEGFLVAVPALRQAQGTGPQAQGTGPQAQGAEPQAQGTEPQAQGTEPQAQGTERQAQNTNKLLGFHWTKQHPDSLGEVYVLGVDPDAGVRGLGRALLTAGLNHLRRVGNRHVLLYTEAENARAVDLYERAGFSVASSDVMYASPSAGVEPLATMHVSSVPS